MSAPISTLFTLSLRTALGDYKIIDVIFDPETANAPYVVVDMGGLLTRTETLIATEHIGPISKAGDVVSCDLTEDQLHAALRLDDNEAPVASPAWPPVIVGPFGTTQSPLLLAAQLFGEPPKRAVPLPARFERAGAWLGARVYGPQGEFATLEDMHLDHVTGRFVEVTLKTSSATHRVPIGAIRNFVSDSMYLVTDLTAQDLRVGVTVADPAVKLAEGSARTWVTT